MITYLQAMLHVVRARHQRLREEPELGATSLEWAIIAAAVIVIAAIVVTAVTLAVQNRSAQIN